MSASGPVGRPAGPPRGGSYGTPRRPEPEAAYEDGTDYDFEAGPDARAGYEPATAYGSGAYATGREFEGAPGYDEGAGFESGAIYGVGAGSRGGAVYGGGAGFEGEADYEAGTGFEGDSGYEGGAGYENEGGAVYGSAASYGGGSDYEASRDDLPHAAQPDLASSGKRRADVTAVDLGYTGRRSRPNHADVDDGPDENTGYTGYGAPSPDQYGPEPLDDQYWRQPSEHW